MKRAMLAAWLLSSSGIAAGQAEGTITVGQPSFGFIPAPAGAVMQPNFTEMHRQVFIIADFSSMVGAAMRQSDQREDPLMLNLDGEQVRLEVEGDGVRLPEQRLDTVAR